MSAVLSVTGTIRIWALKFGTRDGVETALWHIVAVRLPPAEEPPIAAFERSRFRRVDPVLCTQSRDSQESCTAAGKGSSGARLVGVESQFSY